MSMRKQNRRAIGLHRIFALILALIMVIALMPRCFDGVLTAKAADSSGIYQVITVTETVSYEIVSPDVGNLDGQSFIIKSNGSAYAMLASQKTTDKLDFITDNSAASMWTFTTAGSGTNTYYISSSGNYLNMGTDGSLTLTTETGSATVFNVSLDTAAFNDKQHITVSANGYYINSYGGEGNLQGFRGYGQFDAGGTLLLYDESGTTVNDLDGKEFAIVNRAGGDYAITTSAATVNGVSGLAAGEVTVDTSSGETLVSGSSVGLWTFEQVSGNVYYIKTSDGQYLNLTTGGSTGALTLTNSPQEITVTAMSDGTVTLSDGSSNSHINSDNINHTFWTWNGTASSTALSKHYLCEPVAGSSIYYNLNLPGLVTVNYSQKSWLTTPTLDSSTQEIAAGMTLLGKPNGAFNELGFAGELYAAQHPDVATEDNPYYGLYRMKVNIPGNLVTKNLPTNHMEEEEYIFYGWTYTDSDGKEHLFSPEAVPDSVEAGISVTLTDAEGVSVTLPAGAVLKGKWQQVSAPVYFFVNYTGTILDTEGDVAGRNDSAFLNGTAIGHIFFAEDKVGADGSYALAVHEAISAMFRSKENLDLELDGDIPTQILIETATTADGTDLLNNPEYGEANARIILDATLSWLQTQTDKIILISTGNGQTAVNLDQLNSDNYSIRWYVAKEQNDAWHIDGVLTAVTKPLVVTKSFAGLSEDQIQALLPGYTIALQIRGSTEGQTYMTLNTSETYTDSSGNAVAATGQFSYDGYNATTQTAKWTVRLLAGEHVTLTEDGYAVTGYLTTAYSVIDGNAESIFTGTQTGYDVSVAQGNPIYDIVGGTNGEVSFSNTYTKIGNGSLSILKKNTATGSVMQGVEFTLTNAADSTDTYTDKTDASGRADFTNLKPGTYILTESTPNGFATSTNAITVTVSEADSETGQVTVTVKETTAEGTIVREVSQETALLFTVENEPNAGTLIVKKEFKDITAEEVRELSSYQITLEEGETAIAVLTLDGKTGTTAPSYQSADGLRYQWVLSAVGAKTLEVTESGYASGSYIDTVVTARMATGGTVSEPEVTTDTTAHTAVLNISTVADSATCLELTNTYTNEFVLYLKKTDSITGQPLQGAVFKLYGSYEEATNAKDTIKYEYVYKDADGNPILDEGGNPKTEIRTLYYIGDTGASDENGLALVAGLNLSNEGKTYAYVLSEIVAPDGYAKPNYPGGIIPSDQVITVTVENIENNVYSTTMRNQTIGAPLIVHKEVPAGSDLEEKDLAYEMTITISAEEPSVRNANRVYEYYIYKADGNWDGVTHMASGTQPIKDEEHPDIEANIDSCTFTVNLKVGETVVVKDVPIGYSYSVTEKKDDTVYLCDMVNQNDTGHFNNYNNTMEGTVLQVPDQYTVDESDPAYDAGEAAENAAARRLNTVNVVNRAPDEVDGSSTNITIYKKWANPVDLGTEAVFSLYQVSNGDLTTAVLFEGAPTITLDGVADEIETTEWQGAWTNLPLYGVDAEGKAVAYDYYISEAAAGYSPSYSGDAAMLTLKDGTTVQAVHATTASVTVTNTVLWDIPTVGGPGIYWMTLGGVFLMCLAAGGLLLLGRTSGGRREAQRVRPVHAPRRGKREEGVDR